MGRPWEHSNQIEWDNNGAPATGATAEFFQGGTTTPLVVYRDADEATPHPDPVEADGHGRWPLVIIPFIESYDVRVATAGGTQLYYSRELPNPDPIEASVDSVDDNQLIQTGDIVFSPKTGSRTGFVRLNGRTIGSASSGASERANADTEELYAFLWNNFANAILAVTGGRGASAAVDFAANKPIALLDGRSGVLRGVDDMGNSAASLLGAATFTTGDATTGGSVAGVNAQTLTIAQLPVTTPAGSVSGHTPSGSVSGHTPSGTISGSVSISDTRSWQTSNALYPSAGTPGGIGAGSNTGLAAQQAVVVAGGAISASHNLTFAGNPVSPTFTGNPVSPTFTGTPFGSGAAHNNVSKSILGTHYQKL